MRNFPDGTSCMPKHPSRAPDKQPAFAAFVVAFVVAFADHNSKVTAGHCDLGAFIGDLDSRARLPVYDNFPQSAYTQDCDNNRHNADCHQAAQVSGT
jgi:hypothetical protein